MSHLYHCEKRLRFDEKMMMMSLNKGIKQTRLVEFYKCQLTDTALRGQTCRSTRTHYYNSQPISSCSLLSIEAANTNFIDRGVSLIQTVSVMKSLFSTLSCCKMGFSEIMYNDIYQFLCKHTYNDFLRIIFQQLKNGLT